MKSFHPTGANLFGTINVLKDYVHKVTGGNMLQNSILSLTPSRVRDYIQCPRLYQLRYVEKVSRFTTTPQIELGNNLHAALAELHNPISPVDDSQSSEDLLRRFWNSKNFDNDQESQNYFSQGVSILKYYRARLSKPSDVIQGTELFLSRKVNIAPELKVDLSCKVDRLEELPDGRLEILDYKTNANGEIPTIDTLTRDLPTFLYYILVRVLYPEYKEVIVSQLNLWSLEKVVVEYTEAERAINKQAFIHLVSQMVEETFPPRRGPVCQWCSVKDACMDHQGDVSLEGI
jgi:putative RecB family exonuclease